MRTSYESQRKAHSNEWQRAVGRRNAASQRPGTGCAQTDFACQAGCESPKRTEIEGTEDRGRKISQPLERPQTWRAVAALACAARGRQSDLYAIARKFAARPESRERTRRDSCGEDCDGVLAAAHRLWGRGGIRALARGIYCGRRAAGEIRE